MATFNKSQVVDQGSLKNFARWAECYKVYQLPNGRDFIAIRSERDEQAMFGSSQCRGAKLVYEYGRTIPFDWDSLLLETRLFYGPTEEEALAAPEKSGLAAERIKDRKVTRRAASKRAEGIDKDKEKAAQLARRQIPSDAFDIGEVTFRPGAGQTGFVEIRVLTESDALNEWKTIIRHHEMDIPKDAIEDHLECAVAPKNGFLGLNKSNGVWKGHWIIPYTASIPYKLPCEVTVQYLGGTPEVQKPPSSAPVVLAGKTLVVELSISADQERDEVLNDLKTSVLALQQGMGHGSDIVLASILKKAPPRAVFVVDNVQSTIEAEGSVLTMIAKLPDLPDQDQHAIQDALSGKAWMPEKGDPFFDVLCRLPVDCYGRWSSYAKNDRGVILNHTKYR